MPTNGTNLSAGGFKQTNSYVLERNAAGEFKLGNLSNYSVKASGELSNKKPTYSRAAEKEKTVSLA